MGPSVARTIFLYVLLLAMAAGIFYAIKSYGNFLYPPHFNTDLNAGAAKINHLLHVLLALAVVIVVARVVGYVFQTLGQPAVIGEVVGGICLGPSLLGRLAPGVANYILPQESAPFLSIIAQLGIILYMFIVGLELDLKALKSSGRAAIAISNFSILLPFLLGCALALVIFPHFAGPVASFTGFSLFLGVSMSITAFPVLARILNETGLQKTKLGMLVLTCAAIDDVSAWCLLAVVVSVLKATPQEALWTLVFTVIYILAMFLAARPLIHKSMAWFERLSKMTENNLALIFLAILSSALLTESIGIHAIFGSFLLGAITPHDSKVTHEMTERLEGLVRVLFLPAFFAFTGMRTQVGLLSSSYEWKITVLLIVIAVLGKFGGAVSAALISRIPWRDSVAVGVLMNTRGLVELIVLNIGLDLQVLTPQLFTMLVLMALVTTFITGPLLNLVADVPERA